MTLLDNACAYARRGWSVIPIGKDKRAALQSWKTFQSRRATDGELSTWFKQPSVTGLAVVFGPVSGGLCCRDFDTLETYESWAADFPELARTLPTVVTARGRHVYFTSKTTIRTIKVKDGELRGKGGYCLLPPSLHPSGCIYEWLVPLPPGAVREVDPFAAGLGQECETLINTLTTTANTEDTALTANTDDTATTAACETVHSNHCGISVSELKYVLQESLPKKVHTNDAACFRFGRVLITLEKRWGRELTRCEYEQLENKWVSHARPFFRAGVSEDEYRDKLQRGYNSARVTLDEKPIQIAWQAVQSRPLPRCVLVYKSSELQMVAAIAIEMQRWAGKGRDFKFSGRMLKPLLQLADAKRGWWLINKLKQKPEPLLQCTYRAKNVPGAPASKFIVLWPFEIWGLPE